MDDLRQPHAAYHARQVDAATLPDELHHVIDELRTDVPVREAWSAQVRDAIAHDVVSPFVGVAHDHWHMRPIAALAAAALCMLAGAAATLIATGRMPAPAATPSASNGTGATGVRFAVMAPGVRRVSLVGDFNGWDAAATPLTRSATDDTWTILLPVAAGPHSYAFVIDGEIVADPTAPRAVDDDFGTPSSLLVVSNTTR